MTSRPLPAARATSSSTSARSGAGPIARLVAEQRDEPPHVLLGLAGGAGDRLEGLGRRLGVARREALAGAGLHDHHADRVGDDVVQLGGDPGALVADRQRRVRLALLLELARALGELGGDELALAQRPARAPAAAGMSRRGTRPSSCGERHAELERADERRQRGERRAQRVSRRPAQKACAGDEQQQAARAAARTAPTASSAATATIHAARGWPASGAERGAERTAAEATPAPPASLDGRAPAPNGGRREADEQVRAAAPPSQAAASTGSDTTASARPPRDAWPRACRAAAEPARARARSRPWRAGGRARRRRARARRRAKRTRTSTPGASSSAASRCSTMR